jgi:hypothetical protein
MDELRLCKQCRFVKPLDHFYVSNQSRCKECVKAGVRANRAEKIEYYRAFDKARANLPHRVAARAAYIKTDAGKKSHAKATKRWDEVHQKRKYAQGVLGKAVFRGKLKPHPCWVCGSTKVHGHHSDYDRPLDVVWLCPLHHKQAHAAAF